MERDLENQSLRSAEEVESERVKHLTSYFNMMASMLWDLQPGPGPRSHSPLCGPCWAHGIHPSAGGGH